jgi:hypothetical protein
MKRLLPIILIFGGLILFSGVLDKALTASSAIADIKPSPAILIKVKPIDPALSNHYSNVVQAGLIQDQPLPTIKPQAKPEKRLLLENVNQITLSDDVMMVIKKLGQPLSKVKDPFLNEMEVYAYPKMNIAFSDGIVSYVEVLAAAGKVEIDGVSVQISEAGLKKALGKPDFVAADGIVFKRNQSYVKLFTDMDTHQVTAIHYYHHSNI